MTTALAVRQEELPQGREHQLAPSALSPMSFTDLVSMGDALVGTGFMPKHIKNGAQAAAIILAGRELAMQPMRALRSLSMVEGKVVEAADSQLSRFKADGGRAVFKQLDESGAVLWLRHPNGDEHEERFTLEDARSAMLLGKDVWKKYPKAMLRSRVITAGLKSVGWEGGAGVYDPDEAAGFTAPAPGSSTPSTNSGGASAAQDDEDDEDDELTLDAALALPLPGSPTAWGGNGGKPLGELTGKLLARIEKWADEKVQVPEPDPKLVRVRDAARLVLKAKGAAESDAQPQMALEQPAPAAGSGGPVTPPPPGKVSDAIAPNPKPVGVSELTQSIGKLLEHEALTPNDRSDFRKKLNAATTVEALQLLIGELEERIALPF